MNTASRDIARSRRNLRRHRESEANYGSALSHRYKDVQGTANHPLLQHPAINDLLLKCELPTANVMMSTQDRRLLGMTLSEAIGLNHQTFPRLSPSSQIFYNANTMMNNCAPVVAVRPPMSRQYQTQVGFIPSAPWRVQDPSKIVYNRGQASGTMESQHVYGKPADNQLVFQSKMQDQPKTYNNGGQVVIQSKTLWKPQQDYKPKSGFKSHDVFDSKTPYKPFVKDYSRMQKPDDARGLSGIVTHEVGFNTKVALALSRMDHSRKRVSSQPEQGTLCKHYKVDQSYTVVRDQNMSTVKTSKAETGSTVSKINNNWTSMTAKRHYMEYKENVNIKYNYSRPPTSSHERDDQSPKTIFKRVSPQQNSLAAKSEANDKEAEMINSFQGLNIGQNSAPQKGLKDISIESILGSKIMSNVAASGTYKPNGELPILNGKTEYPLRIQTSANIPPVGKNGNLNSDVSAKKVVVVDNKLAILTPNGGFGTMHNASYAGLPNSIKFENQGDPSSKEYKFRKIFQTIWNWPESESIRVRIHPIEAAAYFLGFANPMCLKDIEYKLLENTYQTLNEFVQDYEIVFNYSRRCFKDSPELIKMVDIIERRMCGLLHRYFTRLECRRIKCDIQQLLKNYQYRNP